MGTSLTSQGATGIDTQRGTAIRPLDHRLCWMRTSLMSSNARSSRGGCLASARSRRPSGIQTTRLMTRGRRSTRSRTRRSLSPWTTSGVRARCARRRSQLSAVTAACASARASSRRPRASGASSASARLSLAADTTGGSSHGTTPSGSRLCAKRRASPSSTHSLQARSTPTATSLRARPSSCGRRRCRTRPRRFTPTTRPLLASSSPRARSKTARSLRQRATGSFQTRRRRTQDTHRI
mmetsp:Transcript_54247/g.118288  ORF Transcript_54247/g.118288 Transcript_54247/m.118288 type:complete len:238 (-) Transcript_54247:4462-5175(-)